MKANLLKMLHHGVALVVALCLIIGFAPAVAFAAESAETVKYVSLGDSMTNGYGMPGYDHNGYLHNVPNTYPELLAEKYGWKHIPLAVSGMRAEDLQFVLEFPWDDQNAVAVAERTPQMDGYTAAKHGVNYKELWWTEVNAEKWYDTFASGDFYTWDQSITQPRFDDPYYDAMAKNGKGYGAGVENIARMIQESVADADVISLAVGNANFGVFMRSRIVNAMAMMGGNPGGNMWLDLDRVLKECDAKTASLALQARGTILDALSSAGLDEKTANAMADAATFTVASYLVSYDKVIQLIMESNPDAEVIIMGLMNTLKGMEVKYQGQLIDLGACMGAAIDVVNTYLAGVPAAMQDSGAYQDAAFYFASASEVNMWVEEYETVASNWEKYPVIRDRFITKVCDTLFPMVQNGSWRPSWITRSDVEAFEAAEKAGYAAFAQYAQKNANKAASVATYKAFENAIVQTYSMDAPDVTVLMDLGNGMDAVVEKAMKAYVASTEEKVAEYWSSVVEAVVLPQMTQENATLEDALAYVEQNAEMKASLLEICKLLATPETLTEALAADERICDTLSLLARLEIGDGIGCHPSTEGHATLAAAVIEAYGSGYTAADAAQDSIMEFVKTFMQLAFEHGDDIYHFAEENGYLDEALKAAYVTQEDSWYTALGDATAAPASYVEQVAGELEVGYTNLAAVGQTITGAQGVVEANRATIAKSDLVTIGFSNVTFLNNALQGIAVMDWAKYLGEENVHYVDELILNLETELAASGLSESNVDYLSGIVKAFAYSAVEYAFELPLLIQQIKQINPEAIVVIVGMYNPLADASFVADGTSLEIGSYLDYLVDAAAAHGIVYALSTENCIYVDAREVTTQNTDKELSVVDLITMMIRKFEALYPSAEADAYIAEQIVNALTPAPEEPSEPGKHEHVWGEWTVTTPATCTAAGVETRVCTLDETHAETREVPATGHTWGEWTVTTPATCTAAGVETRVCTLDETHAETREIPATGHTWGEWTVTTPATCTAAGVETRVCTLDETHVETREISVIDHVWGAYDHDDDGHWRLCEVCDDLSERESHIYNGEGFCVCGYKDPEDAEDVLFGDLNDDGEVNLKDLARLRKYMAGADVEIVMEHADVNGDGAVNLKDLARLRKYLAGADVELG